MSDFGGTHVAFRLMNTCAVRRYGFLLRTLPPYICRPYLVVVDIAVRNAVFRILGVSYDVHTLDQLNCAKRQLSLPAELGGLNIPSLELDAALAHYASFTATLADLITDYESESLGPMSYVLSGWNYCMLLLLLYRGRSNCAVRMIRSPIWAGYGSRISWC
jgi:hypothetical protein